MKPLSTIAIVSLLILASFVMPKKYEQQPLSRGEQLVNITLARAAQIIENKYNIQPSGEGAAMPGGPIKELFLSFDIKGHEYTKNKLRELLIKCTEVLLNQVNTSEEIKPFLAKVPFTIENVQIVIYNLDKDGRELYDPLISTAEISHGFLIYRTVDPSNSFRFKQEFKETYEEALELLKNS